MNCEISYLVSVTISALANAACAHKVDGILVPDEARSFAPNEKKIIPSPLFPSQNAKVFSVGQHTYEYFVESSSVVDTDKSNDSKSMTYTVQKLLKPATGPIQKKY